MALFPTAAAEDPTPVGRPALPGIQATGGGGSGASRQPRGGKDRPARWLSVSMAALAVLAAASAVVSYAAQYRMVLAAKGAPAVAALEAGIPDVAALVFATLGIALALHGKHAARARILNLGAVATSVTMNVLAAGTGWRDLAIWVMPPVAYALASDTAIGVVRARTVAMQAELDEALADDDATPLVVAGGLLLWLLRLIVAPASTLAGFRRWVIEECPVAPGRRTLPTPPRTPARQPSRPAITSRPATTSPVPRTRPGSKTRRFLDLVADRYGPLPDFPLAEVSRVSSELAPEVGLDAGAARAALRRHVRAARATQATQATQATDLTVHPEQDGSTS